MRGEIRIHINQPGFNWMLQGFWSLLRFHGFHMLMIICRKIVLSISYLVTWYHYDIICCDHYFIFTGTWLAHVSPREQYTQPRADIDESRAVQPTMDHRSAGGHASAPADPTISCCDFHVVTNRRWELADVPHPADFPLRGGPLPATFF